MAPRTRFAPSPTGFLHIGGARTALFNWLHARRHGGTFVLRIEDTDQKRGQEAYLDAILAGLTWLGIDWDEGPGKGGPYGPYTQLERLPRYAEVAEQLVAAGLAYRDYTTEAELKAARAAFAREKGLPEGADLREAGFKYRSPDRDGAPGKSGPHVVRFKLPAREGRLHFDDQVLGRIEKPSEDFDDFVLLRSDGVPLYNFGCVVDDHDMAITVVGRGQEHINNTFPQLLLYEALGWTPPAFAHFPLILAPSGEKLSKRKHKEADLLEHRQNGILPHGLLNYVARLGWSHGDQETFTLEELKALFDISQVGATSGKWNAEKLLAINAHWMRLLPGPELAAQVSPFLSGAQAALPAGDARLVRAALAFKDRSHTLKEVAQKAAPYFARGVALDEAARAKHLGPEGQKVLEAWQRHLSTVEAWEAARLEALLDVVAAELALKKGAVAQPLRVAVTGGTASPGLGETLELLGREEALRRLAEARR